MLVEAQEVPVPPQEREPEPATDPEPGVVAEDGAKIPAVISTVSPGNSIPMLSRAMTRIMAGIPVDGDEMGGIQSAERLHAALLS